MNTFIDDLKLAMRRTDNAHVKLVIINVAVFLVYTLVNVISSLFQIRLSETMTLWLALPAHLQSLLYKPWTLLTYFFYHEGLWHILSNMLFLYWFGQLLNEFLGARRLMTVYMLGGVISGICYVAAYNTFPAFAGSHIHSVLLGASGAVFAVVAAAATLLPTYKFNLLLLGPVQIVYIALFYFLVSFIQFGANPGGSIAHITGAIFGFIYIKQLRSGRDLGAPFNKAGSLVGGVFSKKPKSNLSATPGRKPMAARTAAETELDDLLDKINKVGYENLTKEEKQKLFKYSQNE